METTTLQWPDIRSEAARLASLGFLNVDHEGPDGELVMRRARLERARCVGFAVNEQERDCLLFLGPYGMDKRNTVRCLDARKILSIEIIGGAPGFLLDGINDRQG